MTVTYQVGGGGHLDIDFWVTYCLLFLLPYRAHPGHRLPIPTAAQLGKTSGIQLGPCPLPRLRMADTNIVSPTK